MKSTLLIFLLLFLCNAIGFAKEDSNVAANFQGTYFVVTPEGLYETLYIEPHQDVMLGGQRYWRYSAYFEGNKYEESFLLLRQDGTKFFCYDTGTNSEHLLFDFGLEQGDTFADTFNGEEYRVTDVRDTLANNRSLRLIELRNEEGKRDVWMEGIGSVYTGIMRANDCYKQIYLLTSPRYDTDEDADGSDFFCYCFYPNNQYVKTADMDFSEAKWEGGEIETDEDWEAYMEWSSAPTNLNAEFLGDTLRVWGWLRTSCALQPYAACVLEGDNISFKTYSLADVDCFSNYNIEARISNFKKGTYQVQLYNKTVELECMAGNPTSLRSQQILSSPTRLYDLQGRQLFDKPAQGIYIEGGKKKLVERR